MIIHNFRSYNAGFTSAAHVWRCPMTLHFVATSLLSVFFLLAGSIKVTGWQKKVHAIQIKMVAQYGISPAGLRLIGLVELFGASTIWFQSHWIAPVGAIAILAASLGAILCHFIWDSWREAVPALITAPLSAFVAWNNGPALLDFIRSLGGI